MSRNTYMSKYNKNFNKAVMDKVLISALRHGDIIHCQRDKWISRAIRFFTRSKFTSHTALVIELDGHKFIVDSQADGTRLRFVEEWIDKYQYEYKISRARDPKYIQILQKDLLTKIKPYLNLKYGYLDLFRGIFRHYTGIWIGGKRQDQNLTCSEFVMRVLGNKDAYKMNPYEVYVWCLENNFELINEK